MYWKDLVFTVFDCLSVRYILISFTIILATGSFIYFTHMFRDLRARRTMSFEEETQESDEDVEDQVSVGEETLLEETSDSAAEGLISQFKAAQLKLLESKLTADQLEQERRAEAAQLAEIFELLRKQEEELNLNRTDESEFTAQMALYRQ